MPFDIIKDLNLGQKNEETIIYFSNNTIILFTI
jgi:hypothetical protein